MEVPGFKTSWQLECFWKGWNFSEIFDKVENNLIYAKATQVL
jgi:hypothetical protein